MVAARMKKKILKRCIATPLEFKKKYKFLLKPAN